MAGSVPGLIVAGQRHRLAHVAACFRVCILGFGGIIILSDIIFSGIVGLVVAAIFLPFVVYLNVEKNGFDFRKKRIIWNLSHRRRRHHL